MLRYGVRHGGLGYAAMLVVWSAKDRWAKGRKTTDRLSALNGRYSSYDFSEKQ